MTSVDSGVETSNDSNDSCVAHDLRSLETSPIKISDATHTNVVKAGLCPLSVPSSSTASEEIDRNKEKNLSLILPEQKSPIFEIDPPPGLSFCNLQPTFGFGEGYEIIGNVYSAINSCRSSSRYPCSRVYYRKSKFGRSSYRCFSYNSPTLFKELADQRRLRNAASTNNDEQVAALLDAGVNPNCYDEQFRTPLHLAACRGFSNVVRLLLEKRADPNFKDSLGNTPLHLAACTNHVEVVTLLLKAGTDVTSNDSYGRNPLQLAQSRLKLLQKGSNNEDSLKIKKEVQKVIEMMFTFLHKKGQDTEAELLNAFQTRLTLSQTKEEVETDVRDLLASLGNLNLNKSDTT